MADQIKEATYLIRKRGFSDFPIFIMCKTVIALGQLLYKKEEVGTEWHYFVTYIDEFIQKELIEKERVDEFKNNYKNPEEFCCLFVVEGEVAKFVFIPYPED